jgi:hypothetical protein
MAIIKCYYCHVVETAVPEALCHFGTYSLEFLVNKYDCTACERTCANNVETIVSVFENS